MSINLTLDLFENQEGSFFTTHTESGEAFNFQLISATASPFTKDKQENTNQRTPFSIVLQGPENINFSQGTLNFSHPIIEGEIPIFIVAIENDKDHPNRLIYQAVFG